VKKPAACVTCNASKFLHPLAIGLHAVAPLNASADYELSCCGCQVNDPDYRAHLANDAARSPT